MKRYGCVGKKLTHSFSKDIHEKLGHYKYDLIELDEKELKEFLEKKEFSAVNVTIPYKETVIPYLEVTSDIAKKIGAVNTIVNRDGKLYGYNTDYYGMRALIERADIDLKNKKVLILGTGGTSKTAKTLSEDLGADEILLASREKKDFCITYEEAMQDHSDVEIIINTTPVGMYPECDKKPIDILGFPKLCGVVDVIYNPLETYLVQDAKKQGIKAEGGLYMLVMQAIVAAEKFLDADISKKIADEIFCDIVLSKQNIVITGMPGSGKSTVGKEIKALGFEFVDSDEEIEKSVGMPVAELIREKGEAYFRDIESKVIGELSKRNSLIISTGGGSVLREENVKNLKRNGKIFFIDASLERLVATEDRPLSDTREKLEALYEKRINIYKETADVLVYDMETPKALAEYIIAKRTEMIK